MFVGYGKVAGGPPPWTDSALQDEAGRPGSLPLLFRTDRELAVVGGRHYLADCGGRGTCYELKGTICKRIVERHGVADNPAATGVRRGLSAVSC